MSSGTKVCLGRGHTASEMPSPRLPARPGHEVIEVAEMADPE